MKHSAEIDKIAPALLAVQRNCIEIHKDAENPFFSSSYATLETIINTVRPVLSENGLVLTQGGSIGGAESGMNIETILIHESGQWIGFELTIPFETKKSQHGASPHAAGSAITYGKRYGLQAILGLPTHDDDGNEAQQAVNDQQRFAKFVKAMDDLCKQHHISEEDALQMIGATSLKGIPSAQWEHCYTTLKRTLEKEQKGGV